MLLRSCGFFMMEARCFCTELSEGFYPFGHFYVEVKIS